MALGEREVSAPMEPPAFSLHRSKQRPPCHLQLRPVCICKLGLPRLTKTRLKAAKPVHDSSAYTLMHLIRMASVYVT